MVTGLQLALKDILPDGSVGKSPSRDSKSIQGLTFGGILRAKEKQLQDAQSISASLIAAAVAARQTLPLLEVNIETTTRQVLVEAQSVDGEAISASEVETPAIPLSALSQPSLTISAQGLPQETPQTTIKNGTPLSVVNTGNRNSNEVFQSTIEALVHEKVSTAVTPEPLEAPVEELITEAKVILAYAHAKARFDDAPQSFSTVPEKSISENETKSESGKFTGQTAARAETPDLNLMGSETQIAPDEFETKENKPVETAAGKPAPVISLVSHQNPRFAQTANLGGGDAEGRFPKNSLQQYLNSPALSERSPDRGLQVSAKPAFTPPAPVSSQLENQSTNEFNQSETNHNIIEFTDRQFINAQPVTPEPAGAEFYPQIIADRHTESPEETDSGLGVVESQSIIAGLFTDLSPVQLETVEDGSAVSLSPTKTTESIPDTTMVLSASKVEAPDTTLLQARQQNPQSQLKKGSQQAEVKHNEWLKQRFEAKYIEIPVAESVEPARHQSGSVQPTVKATASVDPLMQALPEAITEQAVTATAKIQRNVEQVKKLADTFSTTSSSPQLVTHFPLVSAGSEKNESEMQGAISKSETVTLTPAANGVKTAYIPETEVSKKLDGSRESFIGEIVEFERTRAFLEDPAGSAGKSPSPAQPVLQEATKAVITPGTTANAHYRETAAEAIQSEAMKGKPDPAEKLQEIDPGNETLVVQAPQTPESFVETVASTRPGKEADTRNVEVIQQIVHHVAARVYQRSTTLRLQLNPKDLGGIDVQLVSSPQGVSVTFYPEQPSTGRLLETQLNQLQQSLTDAGIQISGLNIGQHGQPRQEGGFQNQSLQFSQLPRHDTSPKEANVKETHRPAQGTRGPGEVDYLI